MRQEDIIKDITYYNSDQHHLYQMISAIINAIDLMIRLHVLYKQCVLVMQYPFAIDLS